MCCSGEDATFEGHLAAQTAPVACGYDCSHLWVIYSEECAPFLAGNHPGLQGFTKQCEETHTQMALISGEDGDGTLAEHGHADRYITMSSEGPSST